MYKSLSSFNDEDYKATGITMDVLDLFKHTSALPESIFRDKTNVFHPIVYFDSETNFTFHFTKFQGDWSDQNQISRFAQQLQLAKQNNKPLN
ncbi:hypothetical protein [Solibacillus sp. NPDC093137]|uniref:hypothetical protein n=1 Tax=Solibacillus sp. NPDC093137 TaxID=3390678 RepID=UPI003D0640B2